MTEELKQAAQQALEALEHAEKDAADFQRLNTDQTSVAIKSLRQALTQRPAAQEREAFEAWLRTKPEARLWNTTDAMLAAYQAGRASLPTQPAAQAVTSAHITWDAEGRRILNGRLAPEHATFRECDRVCWVADGMEATGTVVRRHANDSDMVLVEIVSGRHWVHISRVHPMETKQATPEPVGEVVYQLQSGDGKWIDQTRASYDYNVKHGNTVRILYPHPAPGVPEGFALVPVEPTISMLIAGNESRLSMEHPTRESAIWAAMLAAAQAKGADK